MKAFASALLAVALSTFAVSASASVYEDTAPVKSIADNVETYNVPVNVCSPAVVQAQQGPNFGTFIGAVGGGLLGNTVGRGNGRVAAAAVGAATGAIVGQNLGNQPTQGQVCVQEYRQQQRQNGFLVTYTYLGHDYSVVMPYNPGQIVRLTVNVMAH